MFGVNSIEILFSLCKFIRALMKLILYAVNEILNLVPWLSLFGIEAFLSLLFWGFCNPILSDSVWNAESGLAILKNFPILNCERCRTKAWTQRTKKKRRMTMQMSRMKMTMSWMTWLWCLTEAGEVFRTIDCACYSMTVQKMAPSRDGRAPGWCSVTLQVAEGFYIHCLLHKQICIIVPESLTFYLDGDKKKKKKRFPSGVEDF